MCLSKVGKVVKDGPGSIWALSFIPSVLNPERENHKVSD